MAVAALRHRQHIHSLSAAELTKLLPEQMPAGWPLSASPSCSSSTRWASYPSTALPPDLLFHLLGRRYERGSIIPTSNKTCGERGDIFSDQALTATVLDPLLHHSVTISIHGESHRLKDKRRAGASQTKGAKAET